MTKSLTNNRCCDTHSSPAMTLTFFYVSMVTSSQEQVINCTHCTTRYTGGQFVLLSLETSVCNNQFHCITELPYQHFSLQRHIRREFHHNHLHLYQRDHSDPLLKQSTLMMVRFLSH